MKHRDSNIDDPIQAEHDAMDEAEAAEPHHLDEADSEEAEILGYEAGTDTGPATPAELAAIHTDTESAREAEGGDEANNPEQLANMGEATGTKRKALRSKKKTNVAASGVKAAAKAATTENKRSRRYLAARRKIDPQRRLNPTAAIGFVKQTAASRFDQAVEVHIRLARTKGKQGEGERFRTVVSLPHGTGKEPKIAILDETLIETIAKKGDTEADILLATPALMPQVAKIAKILGPKGKMPNPKTGTVTDNPAAARAAILAGRLEVRADAGGNIHQAIGRVSWPAEKLLENYRALLAALPAHRLQRVVICATFGPGIPTEL